MHCIHKSRFGLSIELEDINIVLTRNLAVQGAKPHTMRAIGRYLEKLEETGKAGIADMGFDPDEHRSAISVRMKFQ
jgi:hypothetical protein